MMPPRPRARLPMQVLIVNQSEVARLLPMEACMEAVAEALRSLSRGESALPLRQVIMLPDKAGAFAAMPAYLASPPAVGLKSITVFPGNHGTELDSHQGAVLLFETRRGGPAGGRGGPPPPPGPPAARRGGGPPPGGPP